MSADYRVVMRSHPNADPIFCIAASEEEALSVARAAQRLTEAATIFVVRLDDRATDTFLLHRGELVRTDSAIFVGE